MAWRALVFIALLAGGSAALAADEGLLLQISGLHKPAPGIVPSVAPMDMADPDLHLDETFKQNTAWCANTSGMTYSNGVKDYNCEATMDGDTKTMWDPYGLPPGYNHWWIQFNLGRPLKLTGVQVMTMGDSLHDIKKLVVQAAGSGDADFDAKGHGDGTDIGHFIVQSTKEAQDFEIHLKPWQGVQHVRLLITETWGGWQPWVREIGFRYDGEAETVWPPPKKACDAWKSKDGCESQTGCEWHGSFCRVPPRSAWCTSGQYESAPETDTRDRECTYLTKCADGQYESVASTGTSDRVCTRVTQCSLAQYETAAPTDTSDRECKGLTFCTRDQYETAAPTETSDRECKDVTECTEDHQYETQAPTATSDRECKDVTECTNDQYESAAPTKTSNRVCKSHSQCTNSQYESVAPTDTSDRECKGLTKCTNDEYETVTPTDTSDRECKGLTVCTVERQYETAAPTKTSDRECKALTDCTGDQYETKAPTKTSDRLCNGLTKCTNSQYQSVAPTDTSDRECEDVTECTGDQYGTAAPTDTSDRECKYLTKCTDTQYETVAPTKTSNRVCSGLVKCTTDEYEAVAPTKTSNRVCKSHSICSNDQYQTAAPTGTSDRECTGLTRCAVGQQYQTSPPTKTSDRECTALTQCAAHEVQTVAPTDTSDRVCKAAISAVAYQSRPPTAGKCTYDDTLPGAALGSNPHTIVMSLGFTGAPPGQRQWVFNLGQAGTGANHWLWNNGAHGIEDIQFGAWNGAQIQDGEISKAVGTLATVYDGTHYSLYIDGDLVKTKAVSLNMQNGAMAVGTNSRYGHEDPFSGCIYGVDIYRSALSADQVKAASDAMEDLRPQQATTSTYVGCVVPSGWSRPYGNVPISAAGAIDCQSKCKSGGYSYFGLECPMGSNVHCQCSNAVGGTPKGDEYCRGQGNPLVHSHNHCVGPYEKDGFLFGDYTVGSVYRTNEAQCKPRYNGGCKEHFSFRFNQYKGVTVEECRKKCSDFGCKSFSHGRAGVSRENWCNVYNGICTDNGDKDWDMYVATDCAEAVTPYKVSGYGSKNCPSGSQPITDLGTCQAAQKALGKRWAGTHSWSNIQSGCFSHANNHVWYNKHPNGRPHGAFSRVCKASASNGGSSYVKLGNGRCNHAKGYPSHYGFGVGVQKCRGLCDAHSWCIGYDTRNNHMCALYPKKGAPQSPAAAGLRADPGKKWGGLYHDQGFGELVKVAPPLTGECFKKTATSQGGAYTCTEKANFITGIRYSQRSLTDGCRGRVCNANPIYGSPNSIERAVGWCKAHCGKQAGCTGFFFQRHGNGHEICGFYNSNMHAAGARWGRHGHQAGSQVCEKRAPSALLESQEQAHETVDTQDDGVFEQPLEDDMDMADDSSDENDMENADDSSHENDMDADDSLNEDPASFVQKLIDEDEEGEENEEDPASFVQKLIDEDEEAP